MTRNFTPSSPSALTVATTVPITRASCTASAPLPAPFTGRRSRTRASRRRRGVGLDRSLQPAAGARLRTPASGPAYGRGAGSAVGLRGTGHAGHEGRIGVQVLAHLAVELRDHDVCHPRAGDP